MPAVRLHLRERSRNDFRVDTSLEEDIRYNQAENLRGSKARGRRRQSCNPYRKSKKPLSKYTTDSSSRITIIIQPVHTYNTRHPRSRIVFIIKPKAKALPPPLKAFYNFVPEISFAFSDGEYDPSTISPPHYFFPSTSSARSPEPFTHIIRIVHPSARLSYLGAKYPCIKTENDKDPRLIPGDSWIHYDDLSGRAILTLVVSPVPLLTHSPSLTHEQLVIARDFMSLALPLFQDPFDGDLEYSTLHQDPSRPVSDPVHVLITGPGESSLPGEVVFTSDVMDQTAADILSITTVFCAYSAGQSVPALLQRIEDMILGNLSRAKKRQLDCHSSTGEEGWHYEHAEHGSNIKYWVPHITSPEVQDKLRAAVRAYDPLESPYVPGERDIFRSN